MIGFVLRRLTASRVATSRNKLCHSPTKWQGWVTIQKQLVARGSSTAQRKVRIASLTCLICKRKPARPSAKVTELWERYYVLYSFSVSNKCKRNTVSTLIHQTLPTEGHSFVCFISVFLFHGHTWSYPDNKVLLTCCFSPSPAPTDLVSPPATVLCVTLPPVMRQTAAIQLVTHLTAWVQVRDPASRLFSSCICFAFFVVKGRCGLNLPETQVRYSSVPD